MSEDSESRSLATLDLPFHEGAHGVLVMALIWGYVGCTLKLEHFSLVLLCVCVCLCNFSALTKSCVACCAYPDPWADLQSRSTSGQN